MKFLLAAVMTAQIATSYAAVNIPTTNFNDTSTNLVTDSTGTRIVTGGAILTVGFFTEADVDITDLSAFTPVGTSIDVGSTTNFGNVDGMFEANISAELADLGLASGQFVYIVAGNNTSDITLSTELLVFKTAKTFAAGATPGPSSVELQNGVGNVIIGEYNSYSFDLGAGNSPAYTMSTVTAVPEPSSFALLGLGAMVITFRRRK